MTVTTVLALILICGFRHQVLVMMFRMRMRIGNH